ncbi:hypothetical protein [Cellulomonas citrea]|uniref:hypothetical protein n=1 Tax=Cellulomonas citrea TaxID=1909423 RepID=UPI0013579354|nr:hypothetical protein [Cellulomonas citrea]
MVETANGGWWAHLAVGALTGLLVATSVEGAARWWVLGAALAVYAVVVWYLSPTRITWVDGSVLRRTSLFRETVLDLDQLVLVDHVLSPKVGAADVVLRDRSGVRIVVPRVPQTEPLRHAIGRGIAPAVWSRAQVDRRSVGDLGLGAQAG